ncbi:hypothetical protein [Jannaschia ovalis]|uniref:Secreted protein n=1 Tax=Jannaschia ovalis TaxID=3038773 RepID=A0ABY8LDT3_9RHOB|nr:hypothetical protein [Jannaschia sp. GRR-S6-38]WGH79481.1 hypothetical protein P8627_04220 [Jannaschia sp. GRR-S6-38]
MIARMVSIAALVALAGPAFSEDLSPAAQATKAQLAQHLGVDAGDHTLAELSDLNCRIEATDSETEKARLLADFQQASAPRAPAPMSSREQLARSLGVDPAEYTTGQLTLLKALVESEECYVPNPAQFASPGERLTPVSAGAKAQLAGTLGLDPNEFTLVELVKMHFESEQDEN